ncbi:hypothetical protein Bca52824_054920 [Brassica carinata]|uniref:Uncharacterized protein n=1 Tax=Brassica carinata TaxID=52824 RepID=A0A8X7R8D6_BRACI|nr:hypothetical protein Bca52824_054920 [Brassica carinata]
MGARKLDHGVYCKWWVSPAISKAMDVLPKTFKDFSGWIILRVSRGAPGRTFLTTHGGCWFDGERCCGHREVATLKRLSGILGGILHSAYFPFRKKKSLWVLLADSNNICFFPKEKASRQIIMQLEKFRLCEKIKSGSRLVLQPLSELFIDLKSVVTLSFTDSPRLFFDSDFSVTEKYLSRFGANGDTTPAIKSSSAAINSFHSPESAPNEEAAITTPQCFQDIVGRLCNFKSSSRILISS